jgi:hypothetical protein
MAESGDLYAASVGGVAFHLVWELTSKLGQGWVLTPLCNR